MYLHKLCRELDKHSKDVNQVEAGTSKPGTQKKVISPLTHDVSVVPVCLCVGTCFSSRTVFKSYSPERC